MIRIIRYAAPETELPDDFPGEDLEFIGEVPPPSEIAGKTPIPPKLPSVTPRGQKGKPYYEMADFTFLPFGKNPENTTPQDPSKLFQEVKAPETQVEELNRRYKNKVREKIWHSLNSSIPLKITYQTLSDEFGRSSTTQRVIRPDYVYWAGTNRHILVAWCDLRNDWRAFAVDNIAVAELIGE
jgi:hypothetical protein